MYYYELGGKILISRIEYKELNLIPENTAVTCKDIVYILNNMNPSKHRGHFSISNPSQAFLESEGLDLLKKNSSNLNNLPDWLLCKIDKREVTSINTAHPHWKDILNYFVPEKWKINIIGLGDVGGTLGAGLRLLGGKSISEIGLYDIDKNKVKRWYHEIGQIYSVSGENLYPSVKMLKEDSLFDCDMFVFCVSVGVPPVGVPPVGADAKDVRMVQFEGNSKIIKQYAKKARETNYRGIFAVVSDPVDLLCKVVLNESNKNEDSIIDFNGLFPEHIRGYGLGVMNGRAAFYAHQNAETFHYLKEGRVFGPHGQGLVVADSICNYNESLSLYITEKVKNANIEVRASGFKPFVAPALSSGSLSIINTIQGEWHYSATFMGGVYMGSKNRLNKSGTEIEVLDIPEALWSRLKNTYESLGDII